MVERLVVRGSGRWARLVLSALVALAFATPAMAAELPEYQLKAEFIERFTRFIEWPNLASPGAFEIGVIGASPLGPFLDRLAATRRIQDKPIVVRQISRPEEVESCHVLFIARAEAGSLNRILSRTANRPILTVGDSEGFARAGVIINFFVDQERLRFEINEPASRGSGLRIGSQLLELARVVRPEEKP